MKENIEFTRKLVELNNSQQYTLSIRVTSNGFCFCILNQRKKKIIFFRKVEFESVENFSDTNKFKQFVDNEPFFSYPISKVIITYGGENYTLLPVELYTHSKKDDVFVFNQPYQSSEVIAYDEIVGVNLVNIYSIPTGLLEVLNQKFPQALVIHQVSLYIDYAVNKSRKEKDKQVYVDIDGHFFYANVVDKGNLLLSNAYTYKTIDELVYHIVNLYENLELDQQKTVLNVSGLPDKKSEEINVLKKYIKEIEFVKYTDISLASPLKSIEIHKLLNLLIACEL